ncbi:MAG: UDP-3-O-(3-hydroxymyristoyl)glucosamine N-acyltransferase [Fibrobacter sp.]|nr:UDP-3-O-(3-hydroxymyristoyl)glucosamine N-acyltransferase [Fibrobacter sp.]
MKTSEIAKIIGAEIPQDLDDLNIDGLKSPESANESDIVFLSNPKLRDSIESSRAKVVIVKKGTSISGKICLEVEDPYLGYAKVAQLFENTSSLFTDGISPYAIIDPDAVIDKSVSIGPGSVIGKDVHIGAGCKIGANCVIEKGTRIGSSCRIDSGAVIRWETSIGNNVIIQSGVVIGSDGFGNAREGSKYVRIPCFGNVVIEDGVEIGANTTIDRGNLEPTLIGKGVKIDNLVHIAHNVIVGEDTAIVAQVGISGSTVIGKRVILAGQAGCVGHIEIGDDAFVGAKAGISKSVPVRGKVTGYPARDFMTMRRIEAAQSSLPDLLKEVKRLKDEILKLKRLDT